MPHPKKKFTVIPHTADIKIAVWAPSLQELFAQALIAMFQVIKPQTRQSDCKYENDLLVCQTFPVSRNIMLNAIDLDSLLVDFLSEALALSDIYNEAYLAAQVTFSENNSLSAIIQGIPIVGFEVVEIKAVTYAGLKIEHSEEIWSTQIVFDI